MGRLDRYKGLFAPEVIEAVDKQVTEAYTSARDKLKAMTPEEVERAGRFVRDLNEVLEGRMSLKAFGEKWEVPMPFETVDELVHALQHMCEQAQMEWELMTDAERAELDKLMQELLGDSRARVDAMRLTGNLMRGGHMPQPRAQPEAPTQDTQADGQAGEQGEGVDEKEMLEDCPECGSTDYDGEICGDCGYDSEQEQDDPQEDEVDEPVGDLPVANHNSYW